MLYCILNPSFTNLKQYFKAWLNVLVFERLGDLETLAEDFLSGAVVKNLPANSGDTGFMPGPGRSHMPQSN